MYKAILFDLDNTLLNYSLSELQCMQKTVEAHRLVEHHGWSWEQFWSTYLQHNDRHWLSFVHKQGLDSIEDVLISSFRDTLNRDEQLHGKLAQTYWDYFCSTCIYEDGAAEVIHAASAKYKLGIVSNGVGIAQRGRLAAGSIDQLFDSIVVSDEAGVRKPNKDIFNISLQELSLSRDEVLFVGDSLKDDYAGANNIGIDFCYYNRSGQAIDKQLQPRYIVNRIPELLSILEA